MPTESLWGNLASEPMPTPPITILKEQASALGEQTKHVLQGEVHLSRIGQFIGVRLDVVAPALDDYRMTVMEVRHGVETYPATVSSQFAGRDVEAGDVATFRSAVKDVLSSTEVTRALRSLYAQSTG